jgi:hypothetical protein
MVPGTVFRIFNIMEGEDYTRAYYAAYFETIIVHQLDGKLEPARTGYGFNVMWGKDFQLTLGAWV